MRVAIPASIDESRLSIAGSTDPLLTLAADGIRSLRRR